ncbi:hypothetical protein AAFF_G00335200 [Aldrovandia affinis]|uniref:Uncharacterized protein n=1 Tax=Aldrovandia affinis TaxID=143900 RepID=A0AAD7SL54_9TELE|nr:hypothetical protein AAFF_G00335200 [Aldrovandia affinis]
MVCSLAFSATYRLLPGVQEMDSPCQETVGCSTGPQPSPRGFPPRCGPTIAHPPQTAPPLRSCRLSEPEDHLSRSDSNVWASSPQSSQPEQVCDGSSVRSFPSPSNNKHRKLLSPKKQTGNKKKKTLFFNVKCHGKKHAEKTK